jgi:predicted CXXCH cytochrome family protein
MNELKAFRLPRAPAFVFSSAAVILVGLFLYFFYLFPADDMGPMQPISFSHRVHAGVKAIQCEFCHPSVRRSTFPGIPPVGKCLYCHDYIISNHPEIKKEHQYFNTHTPTPWVKVTYIPEFTFFNHACHLRRKLQCRECHGPAETMDRLQRNKIQMGFCVSCHRRYEANIDCWLACHN